MIMVAIATSVAADLFKVASLLSTHALTNKTNQITAYCIFLCH